MNTYTRSKYNVYKDGKLFLKNLRPCEIEAKIGITQNTISEYARDHSKYKGKDGCKYSFEVSETTVYEVKAKPNIKIKDYDTQMSDEWIEAWEKARFKLNTNAKEWVREQKAVTI